MFEFRLFPIEEIQPWGKPETPSLSWFALTLGEFWIRVGDVELFRYSPAVVEHFNSNSPYAEYQVAAFIDELTCAVGMGLRSVPPALEACLEDGSDLSDFVRLVKDLQEDRDDQYLALRWFGERTISTGWLVGWPSIAFVRQGEHIVLIYDARGRRIEGLDAWTAGVGTLRIPAAELIRHVEDLLTRLATCMSERVNAIERGIAVARCPVDVEELRKQQTRWFDQFQGNLRPQHQDVSWEETAKALRVVRKNLVERGLLKK